MSCLDIRAFHRYVPRLVSIPSDAAPISVFGEHFVPNTQSAKKNLRKTRAATVRNRAQRSALRSAVKKARGEAATPEERLRAVQLLDRAARKGLIHRNNAARSKSRLMKKA